MPLIKRLSEAIFEVELTIFFGRTGSKQTWKLKKQKKIKI